MEVKRDKNDTLEIMNYQAQDQKNQERRGYIHNEKLFQKVLSASKNVESFLFMFLNQSFHLNFFKFKPQDYKIVHD